MVLATLRLWVWLHWNAYSYQIKAKLHFYITLNEASVKCITLNVLVSAGFLTSCKFLHQKPCPGHSHNWDGRGIWIWMIGKTHLFQKGSFCMCLIMFHKHITFVFLHSFLANMRPASFSFILKSIIADNHISFCKPWLAARVREIRFLTFSVMRIRSLPVTNPLCLSARWVKAALLSYIPASVSVGEKHYVSAIFCKDHVYPSFSARPWNMNT